MYAHRMVVRGELHGELGLGVGPQVRHDGGLVVAYVGQYLEHAVGQAESQRHVFLGVAAGIAEHHALVACALGVLGLADHAAVDVRALLVYGADDAAGRRVELVFGLGVADALDRLAYSGVDVHVGVLGADLAAHYHQSGGAERLAGHLRFGVLGQEFVKDCV